MKRVAKRLGIEVRRERCYDDEMKWMYVFTPWDHLHEYYICCGRFDRDGEWGVIEHFHDPDPQSCMRSYGKLRHNKLRQDFTEFMRSLTRTHVSEMMEELKMDVDMFEADRYEDLHVR